MKLRTCKDCSKQYMPNTEWQKFCSTKCRNRVGQKRLRARAKGKK